MKNLKLPISAAAAWMLAAPFASAHHSFAMFDMHKIVEVKGTVREFHWTNPHSWIVLTTRDPSGKQTDVNIEANGPGYLVRNGWKREALKAGDDVTVAINPLHDGSGGGNLVKVTFADGHELSAAAKPNFAPAGGAGEKQ